MKTIIAIVIISTTAFISALFIGNTVLVFKKEAGENNGKWVAITSRKYDFGFVWFDLGSSESAVRADQISIAIDNQQIHDEIIKLGYSRPIAWSYEFFVENGKLDNGLIYTYHIEIYGNDGAPNNIRASRIFMDKNYKIVWEYSVRNKSHDIN